MVADILTPFLGALQASLSVLLTIFVGVVAAQFDLLSQQASKDISNTCVKIFLPCLLITNIGQQIHLDTAWRFVPIFLWATVYNLLSIALGHASTRFFRLPAWVTPAIAFNNTTSLPLLLVQSLGSTDLLSQMLTSDSDTTADAIERAKAYFLINSLVSNCLTFAVGPQLLNAHNEDAPNAPAEGKHHDDHSASPSPPTSSDDNENDANEETTETTTLFPTALATPASRIHRRATPRLRRTWRRLPSWLRSTLAFSFQFINAPVIGAAIGLLLGLVPALQRAWFAKPKAGGVLNAWLADAVKNVGELFAALQVVVVGVKLSKAMRAMKDGGGDGDGSREGANGDEDDHTGSVPWAPAVFVEIVRFIVWPLISIPLIYLVVTRTRLVDNDPILWFAMMLMPAGPPAMKLTALADVSGAGEREKMSIAKFLTLSYVLSPVIAFAVVGSLEATLAAMAVRGQG